MLADITPNFLQSIQLSKMLRRCHKPTIDQARNTMLNVKFVISGFLRGVNQILAFPGLVISCRHLGTTYWFHPQGTNSPRRNVVN